MLLTIEGPRVDLVTVGASYGGSTITRDIAVTSPLPQTMLAELPDDVGEVSFVVTGFSNNLRVGAASTTKTVVPPHQVISLTVDLTAPMMPNDGGSDGAVDLQMPAFTVRRGGQAGLLTGVWASGSDVYVSSKSIGGNDLLHASGGAFAAQKVAGDLNGVWGASPSSVFLVGPNGSLYKGSGTSWTMQSTPASSAELFGAWGASAADVYVVGSGNTILHSVTGGWVLQTPVGTTELHAVGGVAGSIYVVGSGGVILHSTGDGTWTPQTSGTQASLWGVFAVGGNIYVVGDGVILVSTGNGMWSPQTGSGSGIWASSASDLWAAGENALRSTGNGTWNALMVPARLTAVYGTGENDVWLVGDQQTILHYP